MSQRQPAESAKVVLEKTIMCKFTIIALVFLMPLKVIADKHPTAIELLDKYAETHDKLQSFILKGVCSTDYVNSFMRGKNKAHQSFEFRLDDNRFCFRNQIWGNLPYSRLKFTPKNKPEYQSFTWDGQTYFQYGRSSRLRAPTLKLSHGKLFIHRDWNDVKTKQSISRSPAGTILMGFFYGNAERIDSVLRKADSISVRDNMEQVGESKCYVIDAVTRSGKYTVWIDPEHGYNVAKTKVQMEENDLFYGRPMTRGDKIVGSFNYTRFKKIDDVWIPMESNLKVLRDMPGMNFFNFMRSFKLNNFTHFTRHYKLTEITLNPDFETLNAFIPDDIENGAEVEFTGVESITYIWRNGQVVDEKGRVIMDCRTKKPDKK